MVSIVEFLSLFVINIISSLGYWGVFIGMTLESACIPLPSEIIMTFSGFVVWQGNTNMTLWGITLVGALGNLLGSLIAYFVGLKGGRPLLEKYGKYILITHKNLETADKWFDKYGYEAVLISRVLPGIRTFISLPAGITHMNLKKFTIYTFLGSLPWCFVLGYIGVQLGPRWDIISKYFHILDIIVIMGVIGFIGYLIYKHRGKASINP
ncbi:DedA family protein [Methanobacterium paludis]|uniref:SNARE associated Golgi protein-like protein n=1 Tax=Methanobacterium paludis (strain DSM 25820 / JCM 18151 / SWAN1) TaxID=868131 RepID=F6D590_METPW|nr:DedA family protein [Methanobacterium paludis]AEG18198.1 SNARE associated Golgi protein-like protein [Methanobacterium paludis]